MKTENQNKPQKDLQTKELALTILVFGLMSVALLGGMHLVGIIQMPAHSLPIIGGALVAYVVLAGIGITFMCAKFIFKKG